MSQTYQHIFSQCQQLKLTTVPIWAIWYLLKDMHFFIKNKTDYLKKTIWGKQSRIYFYKYLKLGQNNQWSHEQNQNNHTEAILSDATWLLNRLDTPKDQGSICEVFIKNLSLDIITNGDSLLLLFAAQKTLAQFCVFGSPWSHFSKYTILSYFPKDLSPKTYE